MRFTLALAVMAAAALLALAVAAIRSLEIASPGARGAIEPAGAAPAARVRRAPPAGELEWTRRPGATGYRIVRHGGTGPVGGTCAGVVTGTRCTDTPLETGEGYVYVVVPLAAGWVGAPSPPVAVET